MKSIFLKLVCCILLFVAISPSFGVMSQQRLPTPKEKPAKTIFVFHTDEFWLNLHHFLYVLARAENKERDASREAVASAPADQERGLAKLGEKEKVVWHDAVAAYAAGPAKKDLIFDDPLPAITHSLARAKDAKTLKGSEVDRNVASVLERVAPTYRKIWWTQHRDSNRNWQKTIQALVDVHGAAVLTFITGAYKLQWPTSGFPVHVTAYSNWAGAYSTTGNLLVLSSRSTGNQDLYGLESIFHEGMHQWDDQVFEVLRAEAIKLNKRFPPGLSHSLIFSTAGEAVRKVVPEHVPAADKFGIWQRGLAQFRIPLIETWKLYLNGSGTRDEALAELIKRTAIQPTPK